MLNNNWFYNNVHISVNLANVSKTSCDYDSLTLEPSNSAQCVSKGKSENYDCRNHVRVIQVMMMMLLW